MINLFDSNPVNGHSFMNDLKKEFDKREMKQTAVDWLFNEIDMQYPEINVRRKEWMIDKAKQMEKEQIEEAFLDGYKSHPYLAEQYYKENYEDK